MDTEWALRELRTFEQMTVMTINGNELRVAAGGAAADQHYRAAARPGGPGRAGRSTPTATSGHDMRAADRHRSDRCYVTRCPTGAIYVSG